MRNEPSLTLDMRADGHPGHATVLGPHPRTLDQMRKWWPAAGHPANADPPASTGPADLRPNNRAEQ